MYSDSDRESNLGWFFDNKLWRELLRPWYIIRIGTLPQSWILLAERSQSVSQSVIGVHWRSLIRLMGLISLIRLIRLDLQWRDHLHSYMWMDGWTDGWLSSVVGSHRAPLVLINHGCRCDGDELHLLRCPQTQLPKCGVNEVAGVTCIKTVGNIATHYQHRK